MKKQVMAMLLLLVLPTIFAISGLSFQRSNFANDPDYIYLMNGLSICRGKDVGHVDNPGTPVMELIAVIIAVHHHFDPTETEPLEIALVRNPDKYVEMSRMIFILIISMLLFLSAWVIFSLTKSVGLAMVLQMLPLLSLNLLEHSFTKVSPEPVLVMITLALAAVLLVYYYEGNKSRIRYPFWFGMVSGIGLATKASFLPLFFIPLFLLKGFKTKVIYFLVSVAAFFLCTSPAHNEYPRMFHWFTALITRKGIYGQGDKGFPEIGYYLSNIGQILSNNIPLIIGIGLIIILIIARLLFSGKTKNKVDLTFLISLGVSGISGILIVAKHYHANHYLMPLLALSGLFYIIFILEVQKLFKVSFLRQILTSIILIIGLGVSFSNTIPDLQKKYKGYVCTNLESYKVEELIKCSFADYTEIIYYPNSFNKQSALKFGNGYSKLNNYDLLLKVYPHAYFLNTFYNTVDLWEKPIKPIDIIKEFGYHIYIKGRPLSTNDHTFANSLGLKFRPVFEGKFQALYVLDTARLEGDIKTEALKHSSIITCDAESKSFDQLNYQNGTQQFSSASTQTNEQAHSGVYAVKLDSSQHFAIKYELGDIIPGQKIECHVWRYPGHADGFLVVSSDQSNAFYLATNDPVTTEKSGWQKLKLTFEAPVLPKGQMLSIYIWNRGNDTIYFDDLTIKIKPDKKL
ncbi:MAG: glycosyltransferase 87 family protein [Bacteroidales bacterium]|nr:glycosyltransferase 87 family protein [Bacteroidales bacterium]MCF8402679.1 glycosyltransferase 87 family protein [Bacteroidales bacterium]